MRISVIIPAYNEEKLILPCLRSIETALSSFRQRGWETEVVVCDNNSTDATAELARSVGATVVFEPVNQISRARNTGASAATGEWLIFVDADSFPSPELFAEVEEHIRSGKCLAGGAAVQLDQPGFFSKFAERLWNTISRTFHWMAGSFIFCETASFRQIGGFSLELFASEEIDLSKRLKALARITGRSIYICRHAILTSARKVHLYSPREQFTLLINAILQPRKMLKNRDACGFWYNARR